MADAAARRAKIESLLHDGASTEGERAAAEAALDRLKAVEAPPVYGTPEHIEAMQAHLALVGFCSVHRDVEALTLAEVRTIRNWVKYIGDPWENDAAELRRIAAKIKRCLADV